MRVILVGMPRVGKSTLGKVLATKLQVPFYDSDFLLCKKFSNSSIRWVFETLGEMQFREQEFNLINKILTQEENFVLATGGGSIENSKLKTVLQKEPCVLYLTASLKIIATRILAEVKVGKSYPKFLCLKETDIDTRTKEENIAVIAKALKPIFEKRSKNYDEVSKIKVKSGTEVNKILRLIYNNVFE